MVTIQLASISDAEEMLAIYRPYVTDTLVSSEYEPPALEIFQERIRTYTVELPWLVCRVNGKAAGYAYASPHRTRAGYQWSVETSIYVASEFHRCGIAGALYRALFSILEAQGYYNIFVGITSPNTRSIQFHEAMGFIRSGVYQKSMYKFGAWHDVFWMAKSLRPHETEPVPTVPFPVIAHNAQITSVLFAQTHTVRGDRGNHEEETG